jgi:hypothetical protein
MPSMVAFNSRVRGAEANESTPFTRGEMEGRLRGAQSYAEEAARGTRGGGYVGRRWWQRLLGGALEHDGRVGLHGPRSCEATRASARLLGWEGAVRRDGAKGQKNENKLEITDGLQGTFGPN